MAMYAPVPYQRRFALGVQWLSGTLRWFRRNYRVITVASGSLLVGMGIMLITGTFTRYLIAPLQRFAPGL